MGSRAVPRPPAYATKGANQTETGRGTHSDAEHTARVIAAGQHWSGRPPSCCRTTTGKPTTIEAYRTPLPWLKARYKLAPL